ncbi:MAG: amidohydrolase [Paracoccaceae bacterium]
MTPERLARLTALRHALHMEPEISGEEAQTASRIAQLMRDLGADSVLTEIGGFGVAAIFDSGVAGPCVAVRCELDALPIHEFNSIPYRSKLKGKAHLCGHDGHMAMVVGVAQALSEHRPAKGRAVLVFQPAEETGKGAQAFRADPRFVELSPDIVLSLHNLPGLALGAVEICSGPTNCASRGMRIHLTGKTSHAAAPQDGISPALAMAELTPKLAALGPGGELDAEFALTTLTHARLGEATFGIAPGEAEIWVTLRTVTDDRMTSLMHEAEVLVRERVAASQLGLQISYDDLFESCHNDPEVVELLKESCVGHATPVTLSQVPQKFSEDFGQFGKSAKTAMFWLGAGEACAQLHNPDYDFPDALIPIGTGIFESALRRVLG